MSRPVGGRGLAKRTKKRRQKLTLEERRDRKIKNDHVRSARSIFRNCGFDRVTEIANKDIIFKARPGEFDDAFIHENVLVLAEYTTSRSVSDHLKSKKILFERVLSDPEGFVAYLRTSFPAFDERLGDAFFPSDYVIRIVYCSRYEFDASVKDYVPEPIYLDLPYLKYFEKISSAVKLSSRHELFHFLNIPNEKVAEGGKFPKPTRETYHGSILPERASGFPPDFKVVSFYADAAALLRRAYVLRRDGWRGSYQAYQRMIQPQKIEAIRRKLRNDHQVFVNNLIATLPEDVHPVGEGGLTIDISKLKVTAPVTITLPLRANSVGLIDGQHRLFSYYESKEDDQLIARLRHQQNLLITGIIYPPTISDAERERFEAALFLAINSNQTNAPTALRQEIEVLLNPSSPTAIGKQVMHALSRSGPLLGFVENYFFEKGKLKTSSIVSYGLGPLIKLGGDDSLFSIFEDPEKDLIQSGDAPEALNRYIKFCTSSINKMLNAVKSNVPPERWTTDKKNKNRLLTVTYINSFLIAMRILIRNGHSMEFEHLRTKLQGVKSFNFKSFHSSQYGRMAEKLVSDYFG